MHPSKVHIRVGFDLILPLDRTKNYTEYKQEIDRVHLLFKRICKEGIPKGRPGFYVEKYLVDTQEY